jgi:lisH domain-containing protein FOPNL
MSVEQLKDILKLNLEKRRLLSKIKAHLRAEVFKCLEEIDHDKKPAIPKLQLLINELIREYLEWSGYNYTLDVFLQESGQSDEKLERRLLSREFYLCDNDQNQELYVFSLLILNDKLKPTNSKTKSIVI